jgi:hypothetical protein
MAGPIYKLWMANLTQAWYQLSEEERRAYMGKAGETLERCGAKMMLECESAWSSEQWGSFGVVEYPDIEAVQKHAELLIGIDHYKYFEAMSVLGSEWEAS